MSAAFVLPSPAASRGASLRRPSPAVALAVVALHGLLWWSWSSGPQPTPRPAAPAPRHWITLRVVESPAPRLQPSAAPDAPAVDEHRRAAKVLPMAAPARRAFDAMTVPPTSDAAPGAAPAQPGPSETTAPAPDAPAIVSAGEPRAERPGPAAPPAALQLDLPRNAPGAGRSTRSPALDDARTRSPRPTLEERLATGLSGTPGLVDEFRGEGRRRIRAGTTCVDVRDSRSALLDPFNATSRPSPKLAEDCAPH